MGSSAATATEVSQTSASDASTTGERWSAIAIGIAKATAKSDAARDTRFDIVHLLITTCPPESRTRRAVPDIGGIRVGLDGAFETEEARSSKRVSHRFVRGIDGAQRLRGATHRRDIAMVV
jgi:hypothetical protein